jgi:Ca2+-binding EF-hand superfamily protein
MGNVWIFGVKISCISLPLTPAEEAVWKRWGHVLQMLHFTTDEFKMLVHYFNKMDKDGSGAITLKEFLYFLQLENNEFFRRAFSILDEDGSGEIDFGEFVVSLWNYCTLSEHSLMLFAFDLYDSDLSGAICQDEIKGMIRDLCGGKIGTNKFAKASLSKLEGMVDGYPCEAEDGIHPEDFVKLVKKYPNLMFAAFEIQNAIRKRVLGHSFWDHLSKQTLELPDGTYVTIATYKEQVCNNILTGLH